MEDKLITVKSFQDVIEAEVAKGLLESSGIKSYIFKDDCGGMRPHFQTTLGVEVKVISGDYKDASNLLNSIESPSQKHPFSIPENFGVISSMLAWIFLICGPIISFRGLFGYVNSELEKRNFVIFGISLIIIGIILEIWSKRMKKISIEKKDRLQ